MEKPPDPPRLDDIKILYLVWGFLLAIWAGLMRYLNEQRRTDWENFRWVDLVVRSMTSGLAGVMAVLLCEWLGLDRVIGALIAGIAGHAGAEGIQRIQNFIQCRYGL